MLLVYWKNEQQTNKLEDALPVLKFIKSSVNDNK
ncbi:unnamed protein product [Paramecium pentaurelia]|uniref:Uncharacterized protein n=1 Tax=Paramecium pentaurelia TaxID=43138 RepID=A0A8S1WUF8_9CILI|nr:unnamed protein product [Paramecium pentaurelia]